MIQMLKTERVKYYKVKAGQSLRAIAEYFSLSPFLLAKENGLREEPKEGMILKIPAVRGDFYTVREGDTKRLLCGSEEAYERKNGTAVFYIGMRVVL